MFNRPSSAPAPTAASDQGLIFDADISNFENAVMQASMTTPVLIDFWAPWCGPCRQLIPVLEQAVTAAGGAIKLAKVNIDENQQLAAALQVRSVPTVFALFQGRPVDAFSGALPPTEIKAFIDKIVQMAGTTGADATQSVDIEALLSAAEEARTTGDLATAHGLYAEIISHDENNAPAYAGMIRVLLAAGQGEQAENLAAGVPESVAKDPVFQAAKTALDLQSQAGDQETILELAGRLEKDPADHDARLSLAGALFAAGQAEEGIDALLEIIRQDRSWEDDKARKALLKFFEALGPSDPLTIKGRKKLSSVLFS